MIRRLWWTALAAGVASSIFTVLFDELVVEMPPSFGSAISIATLMSAMIWASSSAQGEDAVPATNRRKIPWFRVVGSVAAIALAVAAAPFAAAQVLRREPDSFAAEMFGPVVLGVIVAAVMGARAVRALNRGTAG